MDASIAGNVRQMAVDACAIGGVCSYYSIPASSIRHFCDGMFPVLAQCKQADFMAGHMHRWRGGHDLIVDVARTAKSHGFAPAAKQTGHILLTDFPTKAGIPIPGFSESGLGRHLVEMGIPKGWLCVNAVDAGVGILAVAEGCGDLRDALAGQLQMDSVWTAFDTFGEGSIELAVALGTKNPILLASAAENIFAGLVAIRNSVRAIYNPFWYINPVQFFGGTFCSACCGYAIGRYVAGQSVDDAFVSALKSGAISAFFFLSPPAAYGVMAALAAGQFVKGLAGADSEEARRFLQWDFASVGAFLASADAVHEGFSEWYKAGLDELKKPFLDGDANLLDGQADIMEWKNGTLDTEVSTMLEVGGENLNIESPKESDIPVLDGDATALDGCAPHL